MNKFLIRLWAGVMALALVMGAVGVSVASADNDENKGKGIGEEIRQTVKNMVKEIKEKAEHPKDLGSTLEAHIYDNGKVLVRGAKVTAISGGTITAQNAWASTTLNWTVNTDSNTSFIHRFGGNSGIADIAVGDFISFNGTLVSGSSGLTVLAKVVKDWSYQKPAPQPDPINSTVQGRLKSIASSTLPTTFVLTVGSTDYTVNVSATTSILNAAWLTTSLSNFQVGHTVRVYGAVNTASSTINATVVRDINI